LKLKTAVNFVFTSQTVKIILIIFFLLQSMYPNGSAKLSDAAYILQINPVQPAHTALADARTTAKIAYKLYVKGGNFFKLDKTRDR
jgi:DNA polymerase III epsilon subunit-like protein